MRNESTPRMRTGSMESIFRASKSMASLRLGPGSNGLPDALTTGVGCRTQQRERHTMSEKNISVRAREVRGFSVIEMCVALTISLIMMGIAVPVMRQTTQRYRLDGAVSSVTGAIRTTRYQALMKGYRYRLTITPSTKQYQLSSMIPPATTYTNVGSAIPITANDVTISALTTLEFRPNGQVSAIAGATNLNITYANVTKTIAVSTYGNVTVTP